MRKHLKTVHINCSSLGFPPAFLTSMDVKNILTLLSVINRIKILKTLVLIDIQRILYHTVTVLFEIIINQKGNHPGNLKF